jgi:methionyl-tRNA formyltransferase
MVPREIFERPRLGSFVFHDSMLPAYRGFSPTVWAIANGEDHTGVTLFHMDDAVDAGDIVDQERVPIGSNETIRDVLERTTETYLVLLKRNLRALKAGTAPRRAQDHAAATYCRRRTREDNQIDWARPTAEILNLVRAVARPYSGAYTSMSGRQLQIWAAQPGRSNGVRHLAPGRTRTDSRAGLVEVGTADGLVVVSEAQIVGGEPSRAAEVIPNGLTLGE